ncbi:unnamed protein product [Thelazia callipaeda]|uniref:SprT-like domain-containing protein n=1 Tax=Thelazia callipaeda TaxID=103827 RepID=A0A0N5CN22_THECL|nr:unnamed protein product [Thelazia callipaeda]
MISLKKPYVDLNLQQFITQNRLPVIYCFWILLDPKIGLDEAYMFEDYDRKFNKSMLDYKLINSLIKTVVQFIRFIVSSTNKFKHDSLCECNTNARNIHKHYDFDNNLIICLFLNPFMTHSCTVQIGKYRKFTLEIGCGWGACRGHAYKYYGCRWTGLTTSFGQYKISLRRMNDNRLQDQGVVKFLPQFFESLRDRLCPGCKPYK